MYNKDTLSYESLGADIAGFCYEILVRLASFCGHDLYCICYDSYKLLWFSYERFSGMQYAPFEWCVHLVAFSDLPSPAQSVSTTVERAILAMKFINGRLCYQRKS